MVSDDPRAEFGISHRLLGSGTVLVEPVGDLDVDTVPQAKAYLVEVTADRPDHLVLDLARVQFMSSTAMALLLTAHTNKDGIHGKLHLLGVIGNRHVERPLTLMALVDLFDIAPDLDTLVSDLEAVGH